EGQGPAVEDAGEAPVFRAEAEVRVLDHLEDAADQAEQQGGPGDDRPAAARPRGERDPGEERRAEHEGECDRHAVAVRRADAGRVPEAVVVERFEVEVREDETEKEGDGGAGDEPESDPVDAVGELGRLDVLLGLVSKRLHCYPAPAGASLGIVGAGGSPYSYG